MFIYYYPKRNNKIKFQVLYIVILTMTFAQKNVLAQPLRGQIIVDPNNPAWLVYNEDKDADGKLDPFFMCGPGDPEGFLYRGKLNNDGTRNGDQIEIIDSLKGTGANSIYFQIIRSHGGDGFKDKADPTNGKNQNPFINGDPKDGINDNILNQWKHWFDVMEQEKIVKFLFIYDDNVNVSRNLGWNLINGEIHPKEKDFIETIVSNFKNYKYLIWVIMEEVQEMGEDHIIHTKKIAETIKNADDRKHVIAVHQLTGLNFLFQNDKNIDQFAIQLGDRNRTVDSIYNSTLNAWQNSKNRYNLNVAEIYDHFATELFFKIRIKRSESHIRQVNWAAAMAGAYVMIYTWNEPILNREILYQCGYLRKFFESTNFNEMAPHDELRYGGTEYVLAQPGESYIAYTSNLSSNIGLKSMSSGTYRFKWYDVTNGNTIIQDNVNLNAGDQTWNKPKGIGKEIAVYVKRIN